ncbi:MAG: helix-turn-helix transcriptional regulator [Firmicutes bacterium]|nr:helix-turn-helix transcriptional regulator [Bacillota bacterium]
MRSIGNKIFELRKKLGLSQKQLADKIGITEASLSRYENDLREPKAEIILRLAECLNCTTDYLLGRTNNKFEDIIPEDNLHKDNIEYKTYKEIIDKLKKRLTEEGIISNKENIPEDILEKLFKYGIEATIQIYESRKESE